MSEYSTGPAAVRKEVLLRSSGFRHTLDFSVLAHAKWEQNICLPLFLSPFLGALMLSMEVVSKASAREVTSSFLYLSVVSLNISQLVL